MTPVRQTQVFVTGSSGFVGLALTERLLAQGMSVIGFDRSPPPARALRTFGQRAEHFTFIQGDVSRASELREAIGAHAPDRVAILAAVTAGVARDRQAPARVFEVNVGGVINTLVAAAEVGATRVVYTSSGSVYGTSGDPRQAACLPEGRLDEHDTPVAPEGLYGISKLSAELTAKRLAQLHGLDLTIARLGTCFGPWETDTGVRDTLSAPLQALDLARAGVAIVLPRAGRRDWLYVRDAAAGLASLLLSSRPPEPVYNIAAGFEWSVADWCEQLSRLLPSCQWHIAAAGEQPNVDYFAPYDRASMSIRRLCRDTDFHPMFDLPAATADFLNWAGLVPGSDAPPTAKESS